MEHEGNRPHRDTADEPRDDGRELQERGIRPGTAVPPTVLVTELDNGTLILQGRPDGPRVSLKPDEAVPLKRTLARAFSSPDRPPSSRPGEAP